MADTSGQADLRGLNIDRVSKDYLNEALILKNLVNVTATPNREIRWYQKTSGFLSVLTPATSKIGYGARPFVAENSWTRNTSYVKKYMLETPLINMEDETDSDVKVFLDNVKDVTEKIAYDIDTDIWNVVSENQSPVNINSVTATAAWDAASGQDPFADIMEALRKIRVETKRKISNGVLLLSPVDYASLMVWLRSVGQTIPATAGVVLTNGELSSIAGLQVIVSNNVTADYAMVADLKSACNFREFGSIQTATITEEGIGKKGRTWAHGIAVLEKPKYVALISNTQS